MTLRSGNGFVAACQGGSCVEVRLSRHGGTVHVRDSKHPRSLIRLRFTPEEWRVFVDGVKSGMFDLPAQECES